MRWVCACVLTLTAAGCAVPSFDGSTESTDLTYAQYVADIGVRTFDPKGASHIDYRCNSTPDSYDCWWRMKIDNSGFGNLLAQMTDNMNDPEYASYDAQRVGPPRTTTTYNPAIPANWPRHQGRLPGWWQQPNPGQKMACAHWELQVDNRANDGRSKGWHWRYDTESATLWIWHWNHQHFDLGWETAPATETSPTTPTDARIH